MTTSNISNTITTQSSHKLIGQRKEIKLGKLTFEVIIKDYKFSYGRHRFLVSPVSGEGEQWVQTLEGIAGMPADRTGYNKKGNPAFGKAKTKKTR